MTSTHISAYELVGYSEMALAVLSLGDAAMDVDATYDGDLAKELQELFPVVGSHVMMGTPRHHVKDWSMGSCIEPAMQRGLAPTAAPPRRACMPKEKPKQRRQRNRKRSEQEKKRENAKRHAQTIKFYARREDCLAKERYVREYICTWVHGYADAVGVAADASILPLLPVELREIMARSNDAIEAYRRFSGQTRLCEVLNEMPKWW